MVPTRSSSSRQAPHRMLVTLATAVLVAASLAIAPVASAAPPGPAGPPTGTCDLQSKGDKIQHVIYLQFDNVHFERDNPNVPSDIEQMPNLLQLPEGQRDVRHERPHDPDLAHGRRDPELADRALSRPATARTSRTRTATSGPTASCRVLVVLQVLDRQHGRRQPGEQPADAARPTRTTTWSTPTRPRSAAPAPRATRRRRGCRTPAPAATSATSGTANAVLENNNAIIFRTGSSSVFATDPTGDMTKVFGENSNEWNEGKASQIAAVRHGGPRPRADRLRRDRGPLRRRARRHLRRQPASCPARHAPGRGGRLLGLQRALRREVRRSRDHEGRGAPTGTPFVNDTTGHPIADQFGQCGFPGFDGMFAKNTLGEVAPDAGGRRPGHVRLHLGRPRRPRRRRRDPPRLRPGRGRLRPAAQGLRHRPSAGFFTRLDEPTGSPRTTRCSWSPSRRATTSPARRPTPQCDGVTTPCTYTNGHVTEVNGDLQAARRDVQRAATARARRRTSASTATSRRTSTSRATPPATSSTARTSSRRCPTCR